MGEFGFKPALKAWLAASAMLAVALGYEVGPEFTNPDSETINWLVLVASPVLGFFATWLPSNKG